MTNKQSGGSETPHAVSREEILDKVLRKYNIEYLGNYLQPDRPALDAVYEAMDDYLKIKLEEYARSYAPVVSKEVIEAEVKRLGKKSTAPDSETPDWMESDIRQGIYAGLALASYAPVEEKDWDKLLNTALNQFRNQYPSVTSADLQTFIIGWNACKEKLPASTPSNGWVSVKKEKPPVTTVVLGFNEKWIDEDFEPEGIRECFLHDTIKLDEWSSAVWSNDQDTWFNDNDSKPTHWMRRPLPPNPINL